MADIKSVDYTLTQEEMKAIIERKQGQNTPQNAAEVMLDIITSAPDSADAHPIDKSIFLVGQAFILGYANGINDANEAIKVKEGL